MGAGETDGISDKALPETLEGAKSFSQEHLNCFALLVLDA